MGSDVGVSVGTTVGTSVGVKVVGDADSDGEAEGAEVAVGSAAGSVGATDGAAVGGDASTASDSARHDNTRTQKLRAERAMSPVIAGRATSGLSSNAGGPPQLTHRGRHMAPQWFGASQVSCF